MPRDTCRFCVQRNDEFYSHLSHRSKNQTYITCEHAITANNPNEIDSCLYENILFAMIVFRTYCNADKPEFCATWILHVFSWTVFTFYNSASSTILRLFIYKNIVQMKHGRHMLYILLETRRTQRWPRREANLTKRTNKYTVCSAIYG